MLLPDLADRGNFHGLCVIPLLTYARAHRDKAGLILPRSDVARCGYRWKSTRCRHFFLPIMWLARDSQAFCRCRCQPRPAPGPAPGQHQAGQSSSPQRRHNRFVIGAFLTHRPTYHEAVGGRRRAELAGCRVRFAGCNRYNRQAGAKSPLVVHLVVRPVMGRRQDAPE